MTDFTIGALVALDEMIAAIDDGRTTRGGWVLVSVDPSMHDDLVKLRDQIVGGARYERGLLAKMFEVSGRKDFGRIVHILDHRISNPYGLGVAYVKSLCQRDFHVSTIYGGATHGIVPYDPKRPGLCGNCKRIAEKPGGKR